MTELMLPLICELGSHYIKCGMGGDDRPRNVYPTIVGRPKNPGIMVGMGAKDCFIGDEAYAKRGILSLKHPIKAGEIVNMNDLEKILHHTFYNELRRCPEDGNFLAIYDPMISTKNKQKLLMILFECFNVPGLDMKKSNELGVLGLGKMSGLGVCLGQDLKSSVSIFEGYCLSHTLEFNDIAGGAIDQRLWEETQSIWDEYDKKHVEKELSPKERKFILKDLKENVSEVRVPINLFDHYRSLFHIFPVELVNEIRMFHYQQIPDFSYQIQRQSNVRYQNTDLGYYWNENEMVSGYKPLIPSSNKDDLKENYVTIDGKIIEICNEVLFEKKNGINDLINQSLDKTNEDETNLLSLMLENICLMGGTSNLLKIDERIKFEVCKIPKYESFKPKINVKRGKKMNWRKKVYNPYTIFNGGEIYVDLPLFNDLLMKKCDYEEFGDSLCVRKFF